MRYHNIFAIVDAENRIGETNESNNEISKEVCVLTVEFLVNTVLEEIKDLRKTVNTTLPKQHAVVINVHLDIIELKLKLALEDYNYGKIGRAVQKVNLAMDKMFWVINYVNYQ